MVSGSRLQPFMYWQDSLLMSVTSMVISACVCVTVEQQSTSSWSGVIEPARCVKSLNNRRQEQVELNPLDARADFASGMKTLASSKHLDCRALGLDGSKPRSHEPGYTSFNVPQRLAIGAGR